MNKFNFGRNIVNTSIVRLERQYQASINIEGLQSLWRLDASHYSIDSDFHLAQI
ncbi:hypothetical protein IQ238_17385 [Pleurocapsales cyanobacterium LEGE 06147]|nr:hypothetical protein [Pleurocapsales cyanobacterium LEGE 06147]